MNYIKLILPFIFSTIIVAGPTKPVKFEHPAVVKAARWVSFKQQASGLSHKELASLKKINKNAQMGTSLSKLVRSSSEPIISQVSQSSRSIKRSYDDACVKNDTQQDSMMFQILPPLISQPIKEKSAIQNLTDGLSKISCHDEPSIDMSL